MLPLRSAVLIALWLAISGVAFADDNNPLRPVDTSSPRATLQGFIQVTDDIYRHMKNMLAAYAASDRLYPSAKELREQQAAFAEAPKVLRFLDLSGIPPVLKSTVTPERVLQLKEILDRIDLPAMADVPDRETMTRLSLKRWRLPNTEIDIVLIESGPRAGDYLVSAETIDRLPEFYQRIKDLPYKPGPGKELSDVYRELSHGGSATIYDAFLSSPIGLGAIIPPRWMLKLPGWAKLHIAGVAMWQWVGLGIGFLISALIVLGGHRLARHPTAAENDPPQLSWRALLTPLSVIVAAGGLIPLFSNLLRVGGTPRIVTDYATTVAVFLGAAWLALAASAVFGEAIVTSERLTSRSLDSQLIRLGTRLIGVTAAVAILIEGGDELGFPAYSVLAGLGVGGLAVALAARDTIANLIGSLLITMEKPFRVGHLVRIGPSEGTVEDVGFRSTRIRTADNILVTIPSSSVVNTTVENLSLRPKRRQRLFVQVTYDASREKLEELVAGIKQIIADSPVAEDNTCYVTFYNFSESSLDVLVIFHLLVADYGAELREREAVLFRIMDLVQELGLEFAFPTRTLNIARGPLDAGLLPERSWVAQVPPTV